MSEWGPDGVEVEAVRLLALHLDQRALGQVIVVKLGFHDVIDRGHLL